jgi:hypothetical protein
MNIPRQWCCACKRPIDQTGHLDLYELDRAEPIGRLDSEGTLCLPDGSRAGSAAIAWPQILFAAVPVVLHLSNGTTLGPFAMANDRTGPPRVTEEPIRLRERRVFQMLDRAGQTTAIYSNREAADTHAADSPNLWSPVEVVESELLDMYVPDPEDRRPNDQPGNAI